MQITFRAIAEDKPGNEWASIFKKHWPAYKKWYSKGDFKRRPTYLTCVKQLKKHMPELLPLYERLCEIAGGDDLSARFLSLYQPPAYISGCSQVIWPFTHSASTVPVLIRNYDYSPQLLDGTILKSKWLSQQVIASTDCLIGVLDGINENGLCISLTFGGSKEVGKGFGIPIILRYILETCTNVKQAQQALQRIPTHMAYNVSVVDASGAFFTAYLAPGKTPIFDFKLRTATNHQPNSDWPRYNKVTATLEREAILINMLQQSHFTVADVVSAFHRAPLYTTRYNKGYGTLYGASYYPERKRLEYFWPGNTWQFSFADFKPDERIVRYKPEGAVSVPSA